MLRFKIFLSVQFYLYNYYYHIDKIIYSRTALTVTVKLIFRCYSYNSKTIIKTILTEIHRIILICIQVDFSNPVHLLFWSISCKFGPLIPLVDMDNKKY